MNGRENGGGPRPEHLLGGYATGSLSADEKRILFEAALKDPALFEQLMKEQALKETLEQPGVRRELIESLGAKAGAWQRFQKWLGSPVAWTAAGALAATVVVVLFVGPSGKQTRQHPVDTASAVRDQERAQPAETTNAPLVKEEKKTVVATAPAKREAPARVVMGRRIEGREIAAAPPTLPAPPAVEATSTAAPPPPAGVSAGKAPPPPPPAAADAVAVPAAAEMAKAAAPAPALDYGILRGGADGVFRPVASAGELNDGDRFKVTVTPNTAGPLVIAARNRNRSLTVLRRGPAQAGATLVVPAEGSLIAGDVRAVVLDFGAQAAEPEAEAQPMLRFRLPAAPGAAAPRIGERVRAASTASPGIHIEIPVTK